LVGRCRNITDTTILDYLLVGLRVGNDTEGEMRRKTGVAGK
jgi:hypothetical protein